MYSNLKFGIQCIGISLFLIALIGIIFSCNKPEDKTKSKVDFVVAVDVGHTLSNPGATSARGRGEFFFNQDLAKILHDELLKYGFTKSFVINMSGEGFTLQDRTRVAAEKGADLLISLHHDSAQLKYFSKWHYEGIERMYTDKFSGYSIFFSQKGKSPKNSLKFAKLIGLELGILDFHPTFHHSENIPGENREIVDSAGVYRFDDLVVLKTANMPAVLLECGVIVNREEEQMLRNPKNQKRMVRAIINAVERYRL